MVFNYRKYEYKRDEVLKDPRNHFTRFKDKARKPEAGATMLGLTGVLCYFHPWFSYVADILLIYNSIYFAWFYFFARKNELPYKMPKTARRMDPHNKAPGTGKDRLADGILYIGNEEKSNEEIWFTNTDARTHILYLGTTGSGKTEGLKAMVSNALGWGSGFIYVDGKADTDLWGSISALARRFGRDDDLLVLNYMTGNSDSRVASNTINPFAQGSASYLTNLLVSLMPDVQGDNAMWKDRAVALMSALMPVLTWQRTYQEKVLNINVIRDALLFKRVIELARRPDIPERLRKGLKGYLDTLPGYTDSGFNDDGTEKPNPSGPPMDYATIYQQHGYLSMQFTRQLQSLADDYGYIFETPSADIDMMDVVLNRRIVVVLIPALEKSSDETANLGKIVGSMLKGMMGATLGSTVEGDTDIALENKPTRSSTPFMAVFDEVGYYTTQGMGVMAAQARSLGFCLVFAGQDLPAMEKRVKEEARSIVANCNLKIFGKLEDPTQTKEFFEKTVGEVTVVEAATRKEVKIMFGQKKLDDTDSFNVASRAKASYDQLKAFKEGQSVISFGDRVIQAKMFYSVPGKIKSLRVNKFITMPHPDPDGKRASKEVDAILERMRDRKWTAANASSVRDPQPIIDQLLKNFGIALQNNKSLNQAASYALTQIAITENLLKPEDAKAKPAPTLSAPEKKLAAPVAEEMPPLTASRSEKEALPIQPKRETPPPAPAKAKEEDNLEKGTAETVSWASLVGDAEPEKAAAPVKSAKPPVSNEPSTAETVSWKDLVEEKDNKPDAPAAPVMPAAPGTGFGVGGFGTGFGGFGGITFPAGRYGGAGTPTAAPNAEPTAAKKDVDKAVEEGETISWKDLID